MKNNTFKKIISTSTALALVLGMSVSALAGTAPTPNPDSIDQLDSRSEVTGTIPAGTNIYKNIEIDGSTKRMKDTSTSRAVEIVTSGADKDTKVYRIDVEWDSLVFTYTFDETDNKWNPDIHSYGNTDDDGVWDKESALIVVKNHSNDKVNVAPSFSSTESKTSYTSTGITTSLSIDVATIDSAVGTDFDDPNKATVTVGVAGKPTTSETQDSFATVYIKISAASTT